jgi:hypothetical protein
MPSLSNIPSIPVYREAVMLGLSNGVKKAKKVAKKGVKKGDVYKCSVCGLAVTVDEVCGCIDTCDIICCENR